MDFNRLGYAAKPGCSMVKLIDSIRQTLHIECALIAGRQNVAILIASLII